VKCNGRSIAPNIVENIGSLGKLKMIELDQKPLKKVVLLAIPPLF